MFRTSTKVMPQSARRSQSSWNIYGRVKDIRPSRYSIPDSIGDKTMAQLSQACIDKVVNPDMARAALRHTEPHGEFKAYVRLAKPENRPSYMKVTELYQPGLFKAQIPCKEIERVAEDNNVISIELREYVGSSRAA